MHTITRLFYWLSLPIDHPLRIALERAGLLCRA
jgi:hypothetical protein